VTRVVAAVDCGQPINPAGIRAQVESGVIFALSGILFGEITIAEGRIQQSNYHDVRVLRMNEAPAIETFIVENHEKPGGMGEPPAAAAGPAVVNAIYAATGRRIRSLPVVKSSGA
jgi:isoquinoline 1-oxidoreductase beta subunit